MAAALYGALGDHQITRLNLASLAFSVMMLRLVSMRVLNPSIPALTPAIQIPIIEIIQIIDIIQIINIIQIIEIIKII